MERWAAAAGSAPWSTSRSVIAVIRIGDDASGDVLSSDAIGNAPPGADRTVIIDRIGRGIGRAAAHEFAHLLLSGVHIHTSQNIASYEYASVDRVAQFSGPIHWDFARPSLLKRLRARE